MKRLPLVVGLHCVQPNLHNCKPKVIHDFFGIAESTGQKKSREIREILKMETFSPEWTLPSRLGDNPMVWMLQVNGLIGRQ